MDKIISSILPFILKYGKWILLVVAALFGWRYIQKMFFDNSVTTKFNDSGTVLKSGEAVLLSERLFSAMKDVGTDENEIDLVRLAVGKPADLRAVWNAFGSRDYGTFGSPSFGLGMFSSKLDLRGWLKAELSGSDYKVWEQMFLTAGM